MNFCRENDRLSHFLCRFAYMKILTGREIKEADLRTIENGPVLSLDLMERAAVALTDRIVAVPEYECRLASSGSAVDYVVFAGRGNNGGDGLAIARLLCTRSHVRGKVSVVTVGYDGQLSADCRANYDRLPSGVAVYGFGSDGKDLPPCLFGDDVIIIDALLYPPQDLNLIRGLDPHTQVLLEEISIDQGSGDAHALGSDLKI